MKANAGILDSLILFGERSRTKQKSPKKIEFAFSSIVKGVVALTVILIEWYYFRNIYSFILFGVKSMATKYVYFFGNGDADGDESMRAELGGKGANLAQMAKAPLSLPVPPGFTITTDVCQEYYKLDRNYPEGLSEQVDEYLAKLEAAMGKKLGDENDPLLVSVRSGAAISMPGMMDTILNLGLNDKAVEGLAKKTGNEKFAYDAYRRFIQMYGDVAMGVDHDKFEAILEEVKEKAGAKSDQELSVENLKEVVAKYKEMYKEVKGEEFPQDAKNRCGELSELYLVHG